MKKLTRFTALAAMMAALLISAFAAFAGTQMVVVQVRPGTKMYFEAKVDFLVTVDELTKHSGSDSVYLDTGSLMFRNQVMSGYVTARNVGDEAIYLIRSKANDYINLRIVISNSAPLMSPGNTSVSSNVNSANSDVTLAVGGTDTSNISFFSVSELKSDNPAVANVSAAADSSVSGAYKIRITGLTDGKCNVSFKAATALGGVVNPFTLSVFVGNGGTSNTATTMDKLMPTSVVVGVGQTWTKQLSYSRVGFYSATGGNTSYNNTSIDLSSSSVSYNAATGILTVVGKSVGFDSAMGQYALGDRAKPQSFTISITVQQNAAATPVPTPIVTPAPKKVEGLKIGSRKDGATLSYSYDKYKKKIVTLAKTIKVDGVEVPVTSITWTSSNPAVITVDAYGKVRFAGPGTATLTAATSDGRYTNTFNFSVS